MLGCTLIKCGSYSQLHGHLREIVGLNFLKEVMFYSHVRCLFREMGRSGTVRICEPVAVQVVI